MGCTMKPELDNAEMLREAARAAYIAGNVELSEAYDVLADTLDKVEAFEEEITLEAFEEEITLEEWEKQNGSAQDYYAFFHDCFEMLEGKYPAPNISSDYDKSVIFDAIRGCHQ